MDKTCYHCADPCLEQTVVFDQKNFCCKGCKTVYEIFSENQLESYYTLEKSPGKTPLQDTTKYQFLENTEIVAKLLEFEDDHTQIVQLQIPHIHCSSCIWVLENLHKLCPYISNTIVDFPKKTLRVSYQKNKITLKEVVNLLVRIGYEPYISLDDYKKQDQNIDRSIYYKLGIAGFAFGNSMFLAFPEYFEVNEFWLNQYKPFFRWIVFFFSLPVVFYAANDYFISAYKALRSKILNIDVPIALGIAVLFLRSSYEIITDTGQGFFDSLNGLLFFLLLGKFFQQKTYAFLSFERDYKSYFPIGVTRITKDKKEQTIAADKIQATDLLLIRNQELLPVDGILKSKSAKIDYSFVTGESTPTLKKSGDKVFAGGKQLGKAIEIEALKSVSQSYLTQLWSNAIFDKKHTDSFKTSTDNISKYFSLVVLIIAFCATLFWYFYAPEKALQVCTAILIVACPCALALSAPFTLGNILRIFGKNKFYLKDATVIEKLAQINTIIFDKTGTITQAKENTITYQGALLTTDEKQVLKKALRSSNHPLSRELYAFLPDTQNDTITQFTEYPGKGILAKSNRITLKIGSSSYCNALEKYQDLQTSVHLESNGVYKGRFVFANTYRKGVVGLFKKLKAKYKLGILSGDTTSEKPYLQTILPKNTSLLFNQKPQDKLQYIKNTQDKGDTVIMIGDGLNDAGALKQSNVGIALSENVNVFSPACDAILDADTLSKLPLFLKITNQAMKVVQWSFVFSFLYNIVGLYFAVTANLSPVIAAILMPLSSISIVGFTTIATNYIARKLKTDKS